MSNCQSGCLSNPMLSPVKCDRSRRKFFTHSSQRNNVNDGYSCDTIKFKTIFLGDCKTKCNPIAWIVVIIGNRSRWTKSCSKGGDHQWQQFICCLPSDGRFPVRNVTSIAAASHPNQWTDQRGNNPNSETSIQQKTSGNRQTGIVWHHIHHQTYLVSTGTR